MEKTRLHIINRITNYKLTLVGLLFAVVFLTAPGALFGQCFIACNDQLEVNINQDGFFTVSPALLLQGNLANCPNLGVQLFDENFNLINGDTITCDYVGTTVIARLINLDNNVFCDTDLNVSDKIAPQFICPDLFVACNAVILPDSISYPQFSDNCTAIDTSDLFYSDHIVDLPCFTSINGTVVSARVERTWLVSDESGNQGQCVQNIYYRRATLGDIEFPTNLVGDDALTCGVDNTSDFELTGVPLIEGRELDPNGFCDISVIYSDQVFNTCGASTTTFRKWTALDACTNVTVEFDQIIELKDKFGPQIICPDDITLSANSFSCDATVRLPEITGTDECSSFEIITSWEFGIGTGPFFNVPAGQHIVTYTAIDQCSNTSTCSNTVNIVDNTTPTPICEDGISVSLLPSGVARVFANTFDEGSFDNCGIDRIEVRRDSQAFGSFVEFDCSDIDLPFVSVQMRVYDFNGLFNDCWIEVTINDNFSPSISCPSLVTVDCMDDLTDLSLVGIPNVSDACGVDTIFYSDTENLACGIGTVERRWTAIDINGNSSFCIQTIRVEDNAVLDITFPEDTIVDFCMGTTDDSFTGAPTFTGVGCKDVLTNVEDQIFSSGAFCYIIFRRWTVINLCEPDPNSDSGNREYTHTQRIEVKDNTAPIINCLADTSILSFTDDCSAMYINLTEPTATDCSGFYNIVNDSPFADSNNGDASGFYPNGTHEIQYTAFDECGNASNCQQTIVVKDGKAPTLICETGLVIDISPSGSVTIDPNLLIASASDNCTPSPLLSFSLSPNTFTCDDVGLQSVSLFATDLDGNTTFCTTTVDIQDNTFSCSPSEANVSGRLLNVSGDPVEGLEVTANGIYFSETDANGQYNFVNLPTGIDYTISVTDVPLDLNGISTFDMVLIVAHILQTRILTDPYRIIAANVNNNSNINVLDLVEIRQLILEKITEYSTGLAWRTIDANYMFNNSSFPFNENFPPTITLPPLNQDVSNADFVAIKMGDIDGDGANLNSNQVLHRNQNQIDINVENQELKAGEIVEIDFEMAKKNDLYGLQFELAVNNNFAKFVTLSDDHESSINENNFKYDSLQNRIKMSWSTNGTLKHFDKNQSVFKIRFQTKKDCKVEQLLNLVHGKYNAELYSAGYLKSDLNLKFIDREEIEKVDQIIMNQNFPNPVIQNTTIKIVSNKNVETKIIMTNVKGQIIKTLENDLAIGENLIEVVLEQLEREKIIFYSLEVEGEILDTKKMFVVQ